MKKIILTAVVFCFALAANVKAEPCHFGKDCKNGQKAVAEQKAEDNKTFTKNTNEYSKKKHIKANHGKKCGCDKAAKEGKECPCAKEAKEGCPFAKAKEEGKACQCGKDAKDCKCNK